MTTTSGLRLRWAHVRVQGRLQAAQVTGVDDDHLAARQPVDVLEQALGGVGNGLAGVAGLEAWRGATDCR